MICYGLFTATAAPLPPPPPCGIMTTTPAAPRKAAKELTPLATEFAHRPRRIGHDLVRLWQRSISSTEATRVRWVMAFIGFRWTTGLPSWCIWSSAPRWAGRYKPVWRRWSIMAQVLRVYSILYAYSATKSGLVFRIRHNTRAPGDPQKTPTQHRCCLTFMSLRFLLVAMKFPPRFSGRTRGFTHGPF
jgi:hypothetical protein